MILQHLAKTIFATLSQLFLFVLSRRPLQVSAWYAGKEVPRTHPICNAMLIHHPLFQIVLGYPLHGIMFTQRSATFEGNHAYRPMRCVCETKLTFMRGPFSFSCHEVRHLSDMFLVTCRPCFVAGHHYMLVFAVLLSECFGLRWYSLHTHEQVNT